MSDPGGVVIIGASCRAAAQSAVRAGYRAWCVDQFGDVDTREASEAVQVVHDWPNGIKEALEGFPSCPWMYGGALENSPELVREISINWSLTGCGPETIQRVRDPFWLAETLESAGLPALQIVDRDREFHSAGGDGSEGGADRYLVKPLAGAAGIGIRRATPLESESLVPDGCYLQKCVNGQSLSGLFLAGQGIIRLLGMTEQLSGEQTSGATGWLYSGSIGPLSKEDVPETVFAQATEVGRAIQRRLHSNGAEMSGLVGIDFVFEPATKILWPLEVNPRYTASVEIYERAHQWPLLKWHIDPRIDREFAGKASDADFAMPESLRTGKQVVYSPCDFVVNEDSVASLRSQLDFAGNVLEFVDIPCAGSRIASGEPFCSLIASSDSVAECRLVLNESAGAVRKQLIQIARSP